jgi:hypothetical protein
VASRTYNCFVVSPASVDLESLLAILKRHNIHAIAPADFALGESWADLLKSTLESVDFVIAVLGGAKESSNILFELGLAYGLGRRVFLIAPPDSSVVPFDLRSMFSLRVSLDNHEALDFAIEQFVASLSRSTIDAKVPGVLKAAQTLGDRADDFLSRLESEKDKSAYPYLENLVADVFEACGVNAISRSRHRDVEIDFALWSDELETFIGNPLVVELKSRLQGAADFDSAGQRLFRSLSAANAAWGLLLYRDGPESMKIAKHLPPNVIAIQLQKLISELRNTPFATIIHRLRNERVHGVSR